MTDDKTYIYFNDDKTYDYFNDDNIEYLSDLFQRRPDLVNKDYIRMNFHFSLDETRRLIHKAVENGRNSDLVELLLKFKAEVNVKSSLRQQTPLHIIVGRDTSSAVTTAKLLLQSGADINAKDKDNRSPLHIALQRYSIVMIELLLENKADIYESDNDGNTPCQLANESKDEKILSLFEKFHPEIKIKAQEDEIKKLTTIVNEQSAYIEKLSAHIRYLETDQFSNNRPYNPSIFGNKM